MKTKILVTGASGQLGKTIRELSSLHKEELRFIFTTKDELDITEKQKVQDYFSKNKFDYCINCAAYTNVDEAEHDSKSAFKVNAEGVKQLAIACKDTNTILIHISTDYVFDGTKNKPYTEEDETNPINEYGKSKLLGEYYIQKILHEYFIIRTSWLYSIYGKNFVKTIVNKINRDVELQITTSQKGTPTSCRDLSLFIIHLLKTRHQDFGLYNFTAQGEASWYDFAVQISKSFPHYDSSNISAVKEIITKANRPIYSVLNNFKSQKLFSKKTDWQSSTKEVVKKLNISL